jgi:hypothetical protein
LSSTTTKFAFTMGCTIRARGTRVRDCFH